MNSIYSLDPNDPQDACTDETMEIFRQETIPLIIQRAVPPRYRRGISELTAVNPEHEAIFQAAQAWAKEYNPLKPGIRGLALTGPVGCGKTQLGCSIMIECATRLSTRAVHQSTAPFLYKNVSDLFLEIRSAWVGKDCRTEDDIINFIVSRRLLFLDDLGVEQPRPHVLERIYHIVSRIIEQGTPTLIVASNYNLKQLADRWGNLGAPIASRLAQIVQPLDAPPFPTMDFRLDRTVNP